MCCVMAVMRPVFQSSSKLSINTPMSFALMLGSWGPSHMVDITVTALNLWLQPLTGKRKLPARREVSFDGSHRTKHPLLCFMCTQHWFSIVWALSSCRFSLSSRCRHAENSFLLDPRSHFCRASQKVERRWVRNSSGHLLSPRGTPSRSV